MLSMRESIFPSKTKPQRQKEILDGKSLYRISSTNLQMLAFQGCFVISHGREDAVPVPNRQAESSIEAPSKKSEVGECENRCLMKRSQ